MLRYVVRMFLLVSGEVPWNNLCQNDEIFVDYCDGNTRKTDRRTDLRIILIVPILGIVPVQPLLVKLDYDLRDLRVGFLGWHEVSLVGTCTVN